MMRGARSTSSRGWSWSSAEARLSVEASDDSELRPPALSSSVGQRGRPRIPTHCKLQRPTEDLQLVFEAGDLMYGLNRALVTGVSQFLLLG